MIENTRAKQILQRDYSIWSHQSWISWRYHIPRNWLVFEALLNWDATDSSWYWNNWSPINMVWNNTDIGYQKQCWSFNWSSSYISVANNALWNLWNNFTISLTNVNFTSFSTKCLLRWWWLTNWFDIYAFTGSNRINFRSTNLSTTDSTSTNTINSWTNYNILITYNWSQLKFYFNWINTDTFNRTWSIWAWDWNSYIWRWTSSDYFNWNIQWVRIYNRVISQQEIQMLYKEWLKLLH